MRAARGGDARREQCLDEGAAGCVGERGGGVEEAGSDNFSVKGRAR